MKYLIQFSGYAAVLGVVIFMVLGFVQLSIIGFIVVRGCFLEGKIPSRDDKDRRVDLTYPKLYSVLSNIWRMQIKIVGGLLVLSAILACLYFVAIFLMP